eukprot:TRINITY_DN7629_c0_g1_i1.p1 TRINITY_DN7629_c0_g1~~TRINITY_DN7629_c0_g1_i1.p1  ORF type:complete len:109 (+),score=30.53 TRINITY_DN7629_c0_g1_i1:232-558(+)
MKSSRPLRKVSLAAACSALTFGSAVAADYDPIEVNADRDVVQLEAITVTGEVVEASRYDNSEASSGTKTATPLIETPQSISVISRQLLEIGRAVQQECRDRSRMPSSA